VQERKIHLRAYLWEFGSRLRSSYATVTFKVQKLILSSATGVRLNMTIDIDIDIDQIWLDWIFVTPNMTPFIGAVCVVPACMDEGT
jgi:hypothetical protein